MNKYLKIFLLIIFSPIIIPIYILGQMVKFVSWLKEKSIEKQRLVADTLDKYVHPAIRFAFYSLLLYIPVQIFSAFFPELKSKDLETLLSTYTHFTLFVAVLYNIIYVLESIVDYEKENITFGKLSLFIFAVFTSLIFTFTNAYFIIYDLDSTTFLGIPDKDIWNTYFEMFYYSVGIITMNNQSDIVAVSFVAKIATIAQMITTFIFVILIIAHYKTIGVHLKDKLPTRKQ